jgi:hypothetical protein
LTVSEKLEGSATDEFGVGADVAQAESSWLADQPVSPFEGVLLHPQRRTSLRPGDEVERGSHAHDQRGRKVDRVTVHPEFLLGRSERAPNDVGPDGRYLIDRPTPILAIDVERRRESTHDGDIRVHRVKSFAEGIENGRRRSEEEMTKTFRPPALEDKRHQIGSRYSLRHEADPALQPSYRGTVRKDERGVLEGSSNALVPHGHTENVSVAEAAIASGAIQCPLHNSPRRCFGITGEELNAHNRAYADRLLPRIE